MPFTIGENVGPYRITERLGQGGMATVYRAYHANLDRQVAIKVLHAAFKEDPNFITRFQREAQIVAKLEHPNIVPVYDYSEHNGEPYLVMKFIEGETLKAHLSSNPLSLEDTLRIMTSVAQALTYAHERGILHRDIKPSNILLEKGITPYLADFGLARMASAGESTLSQDMMLGTPQYISPEQAQGIKDLDAATDIYSLGVILYELVVGRVPFSADTPYAIVHDHIFAPLPLPSKVNPQVPLAVEQVLLKALAKNRADRYPSAVDMMEAFRTAVRESDLKELSGSSYRVPMTLSSATPMPTATPIPIPGIPSPIAGGAPTVALSGTAPITPPMDVSTQAQRRAMQQRRHQLWMVGGFGALVFICFLGTLIAVSAFNDPLVRVGLAAGPGAATRLGNRTATPATSTVVAALSTITETSAPATQAATAGVNQTAESTATPEVPQTEGATLEATTGATEAPAPTLNPTAIADDVNTLSGLSSANTSSGDAEQNAKAHPNDPMAYFALYYAYQRENKAVRANDAFQHGLQLAEDNPTLLLALLQTVTAQKAGPLVYFVYSYIAYTPAPEPKNTRNDAIHVLYTLARRSIKADTAIFFIPAANRTNSAIAYAFLALSYQTANDPNNASDAMKHATDIDPTLPEVHLVQGILDDAQGNADAAHQDYQAAINAPDAAKWVVEEATKLLNKGSS